MGKSGKFIFGALLGAAAAALLTPVAGREARTSLKKVANKRSLEKIVESGSDLVNAALGNIVPKPRRKTKPKK